MQQKTQRKAREWAWKESLVNNWVETTPLRVCFCRLSSSSCRRRPGRAFVMQAQHSPCALCTWAAVPTLGAGAELYSASWGRNGGINEGSTESSQFTGLTYFKGGPGRAVAGSRCEEIVAAPTHHGRLQDAAVRSPEQIHYRIQSPRVTYFTSDNEIRCWESFPEKYLVSDCSEMSVQSAQPSLVLPDLLK